MTIKSKNSISSLSAEFGSDAECRLALEHLRWPHGVTCVRCGGGADCISRITTRKQFACLACKHRFSVTSGTVFNDSHLPLPKWFQAVFIMCEAKKGISSNQLMRTLGVAKKTAWYLEHRIREAMIDRNPQPLMGPTVEVDETYLGSRRRTHGIGRGNYRQFKQIVLGVVERNGKLRMSAGLDNKKASLHGFIKTHVHDDCANIYTDSLPAYKGIADHNTKHESVNHSEGEYVRGDVHTNTIEGAFGIFKRGLIGSFHQISRKHLDRYLDEFEFRYNNRKNPYLFRDTLQKLVTTEAMPYEKLTA